MAQVIAPQPASAPAMHALEGRKFFGHPRGLSTLFFTEMWERFSYYGMRAILLLFMVAPVTAGGLGFTDAQGGAIYAVYTSLVFLTPLAGGWIADRILGQGLAVLYGGVVIMSGHICLAFHSPATFYVGLALVVIGTGLLKPNVSVMVGQLYGAEDNRRDAGFSIFYMGINLGAFLSPFVCGALAQQDWFRRFLGSMGVAPESAWHFGFAAAAVGMFFGLVQYLTTRRHLGAAGLFQGRARSAEVSRSRRLLTLAALAVLAAIAVVAWLGSTGRIEITREGIANVYGIALALTTILFFGWLFFLGQWTPAERRRLVVLTGLCAASAVFWSAYEQAGSTLNLFAERNTERMFLGIDVPSSWLQAVNPLFIIIFSAVFAWLWLKLGKRDPSSPAKFALGLVSLGIGFAVLGVGAVFVKDGHRVSALWLIVAYFFHTVGELCLSPVGLSAMSRLAPTRVTSMMMGAWFLTISLGDYTGGRIAGLYQTFSLPALFWTIAGITIGAGLILALFVKPIHRMLERSS
jgi:POT family proton-dependent oligopeptide transporter